MYIIPVFMKGVFVSIGTAIEKFWYLRLIKSFFISWYFSYQCDAKFWYLCNLFFPTFLLDDLLELIQGLGNGLGMSLFDYQIFCCWVALLISPITTDNYLVHFSLNWTSFPTIMSWMYGILKFVPKHTLFVVPDCLPSLPYISGFIWSGRSPVCNHSNCTDNYEIRVR